MPRTWESHVFIYEDQGQYINGVSGFGAFYWELKKNCENVGVCLDLGNIFFVNEKPEVFTAAFQNEICHVHVKDYIWRKSNVSPGEMWLPAKDNSWLCDTNVGTGIIDFKTCMSLLKNIGYSGAYSLENSEAEPYQENTKKTMDYLRRLASDESCK